MVKGIDSLNVVPPSDSPRLSMASVLRELDLKTHEQFKVLGEKIEMVPIKFDLDPELFEKLKSEIVLQKTASEKLGDFVGAIVSSLRTILSYLNIFAYFQTGEKPIKENSTTLSCAMQHLTGHLRSDAFLQTEGIFRLGSSKEKVNQIIQILVRSHDQGHDEIQSKIEKLNPSSNEIAGAIKEILGRLNIFGTPELEKTFLDVSKQVTSLKSPDDEAQIVDICKRLLEQLPDEHSIALRQTLKLLSEVSQLHDVNKMTVENLAIVFAPRLYQPQDPTQLLVNGASTQKLTANLIRYADKIFF